MSYIINIEGIMNFLRSDKVAERQNFIYKEDDGSTVVLNVFDTQPNHTVNDDFVNATNKKLEKLKVVPFANYKHRNVVENKNKLEFIFDDKKTEELQNFHNRNNQDNTYNQLINNLFNEKNKRHDYIPVIERVYPTSTNIIENEKLKVIGSDEIDKNILDRNTSIVMMSSKSMLIRRMKILREMIIRLYEEHLSTYFNNSSQDPSKNAIMKKELRRAFGIIFLSKSVINNTHDFSAILLLHHYLSKKMLVVTKLFIVFKLFSHFNNVSRNTTISLNKVYDFVFYYEREVNQIPVENCRRKTYTFLLNVIEFEINGIISDVNILDKNIDNRGYFRYFRNAVKRQSRVKQDEYQLIMSVTHNSIIKHVESFVLFAIHAITDDGLFEQHANRKMKSNSNNSNNSNNNSNTYGNHFAEIENVLKSISHEDKVKVLKFLMDEFKMSNNQLFETNQIDIETLLTNLTEDQKIRLIERLNNLNQIENSSQKNQGSRRLSMLTRRSRNQNRGAI